MAIYYFFVVNLTDLAPYTLYFTRVSFNNTSTHLHVSICCFAESACGLVSWLKVLMCFLPIKLNLSEVLAHLLHLANIYQWPSNMVASLEYWMMNKSNK